MSEKPAPDGAAVPGLFRRLGAILYDTLLVTGLLFMAIALVIVTLGLVLGWDRIDTAALRTNPFYIAYLLSIPLLFFVCFWKFAGQTLGMRTWRIRVVSDRGGPIDWRGAIVRCLAAVLSWGLLGLGFLWILIDPEKRAWHDRLSRTRLVLIPKDQI